MSSYTNTDRVNALRLLRTMSSSDVAEVIGCQRRTVSRWAAAAGMDIRTGRGGAKKQIPDSTERKIARLYRWKHGIREIGRMVGWSATTVMRSLRRQGLHQ
ncbi:MAG: helix-turn-helix domain-containing protein [Phycicoccus sp.]